MQPAYILFLQYYLVVPQCWSRPIMPMQPVKRTSVEKARVKKKSQQWATCGTQIVKADIIARAPEVATARKQVFRCLTCPQPHAMGLVLTPNKRYRYAGHFRHKKKTIVSIPSDHIKTCV